MDILPVRGEEQKQEQQQGDETDPPDGREKAEEEQKQEQPQGDETDLPDGGEKGRVSCSIFSGECISNDESHEGSGMSSSMSPTLPSRTRGWTPP